MNKAKINLQLRPHFCPPPITDPKHNNNNERPFDAAMTETVDAYLLDQEKKLFFSTSIYPKKSCCSVVVIAGTVAAVL